MAVLKKATPKVAKKVTPMFTATDYEKMASEYAEISAQMKTLEDRKKKLSEQLKSGAESLGVKDDKGSYSILYLFINVLAKSPRGSFLILSSYPHWQGAE